MLPSVGIETLNSSSLFSALDEAEALPCILEGTKLESPALHELRFGKLLTAFPSTSSFTNHCQTPSLEWSPRRHRKAAHMANVA